MSVCLFVSVCLYVTVHAFLCIVYFYVMLCVSVCFYTCVLMNVYLCVFVYVSMCLCVFLYLGRHGTQLSRTGMSIVGERLFVMIGKSGGPVLRPVFSVAQKSL